MATQTNLETFLGGFAKILENQWQCDVRLRAMDSNEGAFINAHKVVLAARSEVFKLMFESDESKTSAKQETVTFSEMKHEEVEALVEFIYSDGYELSAKGVKNVRALFMAAHKYEIPHLRDLCRTELISSLDVTNALDVYEFSLIPKDRDLKHAAIDYIVVNFEIFATLKKYNLFAKKYPRRNSKILETVMTSIFFEI